VAAASMIDADSCTTFTYGYINPFGNTFGYYPYYAGYAAPMAFPCVSPAFCTGVSTYYLYQPYSLVCPGPPATMEVSQASATCASATNIQVKVRDANGLNVLDGTSVSFTVTPFAQITGTVETNGGEATASLTTPTKTSGTLTLTVTAGSVTRTSNIDVSCSAPGTVAYGGGSSTSATASAGPTSAPTVIYAAPTGYGGY
jgi:hypothetical protein